MNDFKVTPWEVTGDIDYDELVVRFGTKAIDQSLLDRIASYGPLHPLLRRGIFYSQRDMEWILNEYDKGNKFFLYTGRGPSGQIHLGHLMPWIFTKYLQDTFGAKLYFQLTDDEKYLFKEDLSLDDVRRATYDNILDIIALGFDPKKTMVVIDTERIDVLYPLALQVAKRITFSTAKAVFGFDNSNNIGEIFYTAMQSAPCFIEKQLYGRSTPCLIPCGIDQDPHFRVTRDVAPLIGQPKPALLHCKMFPALGGGDKMSSSQPSSTIYTTDTPKEVKKKVGNAFTGGAVTVEEQRRDGGKPEICAVFKYNFYLFEEDDHAINVMAERCKKGEVLCGECKKLLTEKIVKFLEGHQKRREEAKERIQEFLLPRP
ncbi:MAG TPA: tryptophan--tRNA ligase [Methanomassiliicoccales archaeon]|nr:tryptophan--tRNA ligase [Methanomassiliicoccales archaeon]